MLPAVMAAPTSPVPEAKAPAPPGRFSALKLLVAAAALLIVLLLALVFAYQRFWRAPAEAAVFASREIAAQIKDLFDITPRVTVNHLVVIRESSPAFDLATVNREFVQEYEWKHVWLHSEKALKIRGRFRIKGGFDLSRPCVLDVKGTAPLKISAHFPPPKVLSVELISHEIEASENGYWNRLRPEDHEEAINNLTREARLRAADAVLDEARRNLEEKLRGLAQRRGGEIEFEYGLAGR